MNRIDMNRSGLYIAQKSNLQLIAGPFSKKNLEKELRIRHNTGVVGVQHKVLSFFNGQYITKEI